MTNPTIPSPQPRERPTAIQTALLFAAFAVPLIASLFFKDNWLWMDEVLSSLMIDDPSIHHMNAAIVSGMDANPPLFPNIYWLIGHAISTNIYFLRSVSVVLFAGTVAMFYRFACRLLPFPRTLLVLILAIGSFTYLNLSLATQIRSYALFYAVGLGYFIALQRLWSRPESGVALVCFVGAGALLLYSHNFGLFYLAASGALFGVRWLIGRGRWSFYPVLAHAAAAAIWLVGWYPSFAIQAEAGEPHSWISLPTVRSFFATVGELAPAFSAKAERVPALVLIPILRFAILALAFVYFVRRASRRGLLWRLDDDPAFRFYFIAGYLHFTVIAIALVVSFAHTSVFLSRYLWPSELLVMYQIIYITYRLIGQRVTLPIWAPALGAAVFAGVVFVQNRKVVIFPSGIVPALHRLDPRYPVFVETADYLLPLWYHHTGIPVHYVLDWTSASLPDNALNATVENHILQGVHDHYAIPGIDTLSDFNATKFPHFYLVDEKAVLEFERFLNSGAIQVLRVVPVDVPGHRILECRFAPAIPPKRA